MKKDFKNVVVAGMGLLMLAGQAGQAIAANNANFDDVKQLPWAQKYITKMALLKVIEGRENGKFDPQSNVSKQEAIAMALRLMGADQSVGTGDASLPADNWAKPYVTLALELGLIEKSELTSTGNIIWGQQAASREWITSMVVKAINREKEAAEWANDAAAFNDRAEVSPALLGYVNVAYKLKLIEGFPGNLFKPKALVTRAQMAVILSNSLPYLTVDNNLENAAQKVAYGVLTAISSNSLTVTVQGKSVKYNVTSDTVIFGKNSGELKSVSSLVIGQAVSIVHTGSDANMIEVTETLLVPEDMLAKLSKTGATGLLAHRCSWIVRHTGCSWCCWGNGRYGAYWRNRRYWCYGCNRCTRHSRHHRPYRSDG